MLPELLCRTYAAYKGDTDYVANWLASTAKQCGHAPQVLNEEKIPDERFESQTSTQAIAHVQSDRPPPRLKGRARKLARDTATRDASLRDTSKLAEDYKPAPPPRTYTIAIASFITLAHQIIAYQKPRIKVPAEMGRRINRAIEYRKGHHRHFKADSSAEPSPGGDGHAYFISVLERVREILSPRMPAESATKPLSRTMNDLSLKQKDKKRSQNAYQELEIEQVSEEFLRGSLPENQDPRSNQVEKNVRYRAESLPKAEEQFYGAHDLLIGLWEVRDYLERLWKMYRMGHIDLHAAALTTNTAITIVRNLQEDYDRCFPEHADFLSVVGLYYHAKCELKNQDPAGREDPDDIINMNMYDEAEALLIPTWTIVSMMNKSITPGKIFVYSGGRADPRDLSKPWGEKTPREKINDDRQVIYEAFTSFTALARLHRDKAQPISDDELLRGVRGMSPDKSVPLWFAFAIQSFLDIQHQLGSQTHRAFDELQEGVKWLSSSLKQSIAFHRNHPHPFWPADLATALPNMLEHIEIWTKHDFIEEVVCDVSSGWLSQEMRGEPFYILKQYPVLCGIWLFMYRYSVQVLSILFASRWNSVAYCAHLYNALKKEGLIGRWHDMESLLRLQGVDKLFIGGRPNKISSYLKQWSLSVGGSLEVMANHRRSHRMKFSIKGVRGLNNDIGMSALFVGRHLEGKHSLSIDLSAMEKRIKSMYASEHLRVEFTEDVDDEYATAELGRIKTEAGSKTKLTLDNFLEGLANCLYNEGVHLTFDYLRFHRFCHKVLSDVRSQTVDEIEPMFPPEAFVGKEQMRLPYFVGDVFMQAAEWELAIKKARSRKSGKDNKQASMSVNEIFLRAAVCMQSATQGQAGSMVCDMVEKQTGYALVWGTGAAEDTQWRRLANAEAIS